jgi:fluoroquinolone transport system permease protein
MKRLLAAIRWDFRLQYRQGFYYAAIFVAVFMVLILLQLPDESLPIIMPVVILGNMTVNTYYFMAGLVLLEKDDGVLEALVVSPLLQREYLWSKLLTLTILTLLENVLIILLVYGFNFNWLYLLAGIFLTAFFNCLYGFIIVARYDSINNFILPSVLWTMVLSIPILDYLGIWVMPLMYLHPVQAMLTLLKGAFQPIELWEAIYGVLYSTLWIGILFTLAKRAFDRFIILKQGVRA